MIDMKEVHHCDVCDKAMVIAEMGYIGKEEP